MSHDYLFPLASISQRKMTEVKYIHMHICTQFSNLRKVGALKPIKTEFERGLDEVRIKAISQETRTSILSETKRAKKKVSSSDQLLKTRFFPPILL